MRIPALLAVIGASLGCATPATVSQAPAPAAPAPIIPPIATPAMSVPAGGSAPVSKSSLRQFVDSLIDVPDFRSAQWGIIVVDPGRGETLYSRNADKLFMPASNMKLLTAGTALAQLGPDYRWRTTLSKRGPVRNGVLSGDLVVWGNGDPSMSAHMQKGDALAPMRAIADSLKAHGINSVHGRLIAAPSVFTDAPLGLGWAWNDLDDSYSAGIDALYFNEGFTEVVVHGGVRAGEAVVATTRPAATYPSLIVRAHTEAVASNTVSVAIDSSRGGVLVTGAIAPNDSVVLELSFRNQSLAYLGALHEALASRGISVTNVGRDSTVRSDSLFTLMSPPLRDVLPFFEKPSQNQIGEILFKTLALEKTGVGRADSASRVVSRQVLAWGASADGFAIRDGSGLSRHDYLAPRTLITVLDAIRRDANFRLLYDALPIAGVDGTIRSRMKGTPAQGNVHAKTGTLDKARSLSGYVTTADGHMLLFSALCNNYVVPTRRVDAVSDALAVRLASMQLDP